MKVYVASSWRNEERQQLAVKVLRDAGHEVYDFRNPAPGDNGFAWRQIDPDRAWLTDPRRFRAGLEHPIAEHGFALDMGALRACDACVLVLPCGRSAHLELGWAAGTGKLTAVWLDAPLSEPELMYKMCSALCVTMDEVLEALRAEVTSHAVIGNENHRVETLERALRELLNATDELLGDTDLDEPDRAQLAMQRAYAALEG